MPVHVLEFTTGISLVFVLGLAFALGRYAQSTTRLEKDVIELAKEVRALRETVSALTVQLVRQHATKIPTPREAFSTRPYWQRETTGGDDDEGDT